MNQQEQETVHLRSEVKALKEDVAELKNDVKELVAAWKAAQTFTSFIKWIASIATAAGVIIAAVKGIKS